MLVSQILWYFIEGVNFKKKEYNNSFKEFTKSIVPLENEHLVFIAKFLEDGG